MHLISFYRFIALAGSHSAALSKSGESGHPCLVPDPREQAFSFLPLCMMLAIGVFFNALYQVRKFPYIPNLLSVYYE